MKLSGLFNNEEEETQPGCSPKRLESALMVSIKKQMANSPHCVQILPSVRVESTNATPCVDATAPSLDVEIPDHTLYHFPVMRRVHAQDVSSEHLNGTPGHPNSKQDEAFPVENNQLHQSKTKDGHRNRFLPLTSPPPTPKRENALPKAVSADFTSPDVPSMGFPSAWKWSDRNHRYHALDLEIDTASDTESDPDLALARSPATIIPVTAYNVPLPRDRKGKDRVVPSPATRSTSSARNSPSGGSEDFTFADMPYSLPLSRITILEDGLEKADYATSTTAVVDESEDLAFRDAPYSSLVPLLWDGDGQGSVEEVKPLTFTAVEMDGSEKFAALGDMPYNVPLCQDVSGKDKHGKLEPVIPIAKLNRPLSSFTNPAHLVQCPPSADSSMRTTSSCATTTHDDLCYAPPPSWPKLHVREEVASDRKTSSTMQQTAWSELPFDPDINMKHTLEPLSPTEDQKSKASSELPFDPDINMKHTLEPLSPTKSQKSKASSQTSWSKDALSALPYRLISTSPSGLTNSHGGTGTKDGPEIEIEYESEDVSFQDSGTSTEESITPPGTKEKGSPSSRAAIKSTMILPRAEKPGLQSTIITPDFPLAKSDLAFNELPALSEWLSRPGHCHSEYHPPVFKVKHIPIPERETLDNMSANATKGSSPSQDRGLEEPVPKLEHALTAADHSRHLAEEARCYWMDGPIEQSKEGFLPEDRKDVRFERDPAMMDSFAVRHYGRAPIPDLEEEDGVVETGDGVTAWDDEVKKRVAEHLLKVVYDLEALAGLAGQAARAA